MYPHAVYSWLEQKKERNHGKNYFLLGVQISSVRFSKDGFSYCEWFIVTADFGGFREVKHLLIIFSLYEFHTKTLIFTVFEMSNFVLTKQHLREVLIFCFNWKKSEAHRMLVKFMVTLLQLINHVGNGFDVSRMEIHFSIEDKPRSGQPKKFEDKELEVRLEEDQSQTQEELAESLRITQRAVSVRLRVMRMIQKQGN